MDAPVAIPAACLADLLGPCLNAGLYRAPAIRVDQDLFITIAAGIRIK